MVDVDVVTKDDLAEQSLKYYGKWAAAAAVAPPIADLAVVTGIQLKMMKDLSKIYGVPFREDWGKATLGALLASIIPAKAGMTAGLFAVRAIPVVGSIVGAVTLPAFYYGATVAIGRVFKRHFASGGTMLDFRADEAKEQVAADAAAASESFKPPASRRSAEARTT